MNTKMDRAPLVRVSQQQASRGSGEKSRELLGSDNSPEAIGEVPWCLIAPAALEPAETRTIQGASRSMTIAADSVHMRRRRSVADWASPHSSL